MKKDKVSNSKAASKKTGGIRVYEALKESIISLELPPGADLDELELVKTYQVSRTPVREAMIRLSAEGLVTILPNRGASVSAMSFSYIQNHLEAMDLLVPALAHLAAVRRTEKELEQLNEAVEDFRIADEEGSVSGEVEAVFNFHSSLAHASENEALESMYKQLLYAKLRISKLGLMNNSTDSIDSNKKHREQVYLIYKKIVKAISEKNPQKAEEHAKALVKMVRQRISAVLLSSTAINLNLGQFN